MTQAEDGTRLFDGQSLRATFFAGRGPGLFVTFDFRQTGRSGFAPANRSSAAESRGLSQLSIRSARNDWFINAETEALEEVLRDLGRRHPGARLLGWSMGGYGALRFARALGAAHVVAVSPQATLDPATAPWDRRYRAESRGFDPALGALAPRAMPDLGGLLLYDPFIRADARHARLIAASFPALTLVPLSFGGHPATRVLRQGGRASLVQQAALDDGTDAATIRAAHRAARHRSAAWWSGLAAAAGRHPALAARARDRAAELTAAASPLPRRRGRPA